MFYLGEILTEEDILRGGSKYTFTFEHGRFFEYRFSGWVLENLIKHMKLVSNVEDCTRPLFSNRYVILITPKVDIHLEDILSHFFIAWEKMGYSNVEFVAAEGGKNSTFPGGITQVTQEVTKGIGGAVIGISKPLIPLLLIGGITYFLLIRRK